MNNFINIIGDAPLAKGGVVAGILAILSGALIWLKKIISKNKGIAFSAINLLEDIVEVADTYDKAYEDQKLSKTEIKELSEKIKEVRESIKNLKEAIKNRKQN